MMIGSKDTPLRAGRALVRRYMGIGDSSQQGGIRRLPSGKRSVAMNAWRLRRLFSLQKLKANRWDCMAFPTAYDSVSKLQHFGGGATMFWNGVSRRLQDFASQQYGQHRRNWTQSPPQTSALPLLFMYLHSASSNMSVVCAFCAFSIRCPKRLPSLALSHIPAVLHLSIFASRTSCTTERFNARSLERHLYATCNPD
jgi:hypothetical protein